MNHPFDSAPCGLFSFDGSGKLVDVNLTLCSWLQLQPGEWRHKPVDLLFTVSSRIFYQTHLFPLLRLGQQVSEIFLTLQRTDGSTAPVLLAASTATVGQDTLYTCACLVVAQRKQFEDELVAARTAAQDALRNNGALQELSAQLREQSRRLDEQLALIRRQHAELVQLGHAVTHEMQEPLRKIAIFSELVAQASPATDPDAARNGLQRSIKQMRTVVSGLQQYLWLHETAIQPRPIDLAQAVQQAAQHVETRFGTGCLAILVAPSPEVTADPQQLQVLLVQLLCNAVQFKKDPGPARVSVSGTLLRKNAYRELADHYRFEQFVKLSICDEGTGFDPQYRTLVFGLFQRLHHGEHRGIGLALCKMIVDLHGGVISIDPVPGRGTTVNVFLPLVAGQFAGDVLPPAAA